jgi:poly-beta-hydroxyalkanoate depolymerase
VVRLAKASFTFADGIDYLAWKINRHAGTQIVITPWQRRHPLLAAIMLLPRLVANRAVG